MGTHKYTKADWKGMNWIRQEKRLAIYIRDGLCCCYCGKGVEDGVRLSLDHVMPDVNGGDNSASNLTTACLDCNTRRGNMTLEDWCRKFTRKRNGLKRGKKLSAAKLQRDIEHRLTLDIAEYKVYAKELIARRGSARKAVKALAA